VPLVAVQEPSGRAVHHLQVGAPDTVTRGRNPSQKVEGRDLEGRSMNPSLGSRPAEPGATQRFVGTRFVRRLQVSIRDIVRSSCGGES
jgi:hypothetical protein